MGIVALTTSIGVFLSADRKKKMLVFSELYEFNEQLILNLRFSRDEIYKIARPFRYVTDILSGKQILKKGDNDVVVEYFRNIGSTDALSQVDYLTERKETLRKKKEESAAEYKKYGALYVKIFFLIGALLAVLLA